MSLIKLYVLLFCSIFLATASDLSSLAWHFGKGGFVVAALNTMA